MKSNSMLPSTDNCPLLEIRDVSKIFTKKLDFIERFIGKVGGTVQEQRIQAVDSVNFSMRKGQVVGLVGESGCGKSSLGRLIAGILSLTSGSIIYKGINFLDLTPREMKKASLKVQMIFQDPFASLNPRMRIKDSIGEAPLAHRIIERNTFDTYLDEIMVKCGLDPIYKSRYPHQFSGGQRQRIGIARALAVQPDIIISDEATAALDVSIQAQILNLFTQLQKSMQLTYLFISHDLGVVEHISDTIMIMYLGRIVEIAQTDQLFSAPFHPYTDALLKEIPRLENRHHNFDPLKGEIPSPLNPPTGCHFHPRCPKVQSKCKKEVPKLIEISPQRQVACFAAKA